MFTHYPTYNRYRAIRLRDPMMQGEDVYALQTALSFVGCDPGDEDGIFGTKTQRAVKAAQSMLALVVDGISGTATQRALALAIAKSASEAYGAPYELLHGQLEHESSFLLGNYSAQRPDGSYDAGVAQRNTAHTAPASGFDAGDSIVKLAVLQRQSYNLYQGIPTTKRRWALAAGTWNAPAYAAYIAREEGAINVPIGSTARPSDAARWALEDYMSAVTIYLGSN